MSQRPVMPLRFLMVLALCIGAFTAMSSAQQGDDPTHDPARGKIDELLDKWRTSRTKIPVEDLAQALAGTGRGSATYLCELVDNKRHTIPIRAVAMAIGRQRQQGSLATLTRLLEAPEVNERVAAVEALELFGSRECLDLLARTLDEERDEVASRAEAALLVPGHPREILVQTVVGRLRHAKDKGRVARVLGRLGGKESRAALLELLSEPNERSHLAALQGVWCFEDFGDGSVVLQCYRDSTVVAVKKQACLVLGKLGFRSAVRDMIDALRSEDKGLTANAHWALGKLTGLKLKADSDLWEQWWTRTGREQTRTSGS